MPESDANSVQNVRKAILQKALQIARENPDLDEVSLLAQAEDATASLFEQMGKPQKSAPEPAPARPRRSKRKHHERKDHVGRFFLRLMENELRDSKVLPCLVPVFAHSVEELLGDDDCKRLTEKIARLIDFGSKKGFNYDQILDSKPGKGITAELMQLYRAEAQGSYFEKKLKNNLDQALVNFVTHNAGENINIEDSIQLAFDQFLSLLAKAPKAPAA